MFNGGETYKIRQFCFSGIADNEKIIDEYY